MTRLEKIRAKMKEKELCALLVTSGENRRYVTGFGSSAGNVLITMGKAYFIVDFRYIEAAKKGANPDITVTQLKKTFMEDLAEIVKEQGIKRIGFENRTMSVFDFENYKAQIDAEFVAFDDGIEIVRRNKDAHELECIKKAQAIAEAALTEALKQFKVGMTEKDVATLLTYEMSKHGSEGLAFPVIAVSGKNSSLPHGVPTDKKIEEGDFLTMDFGAKIGGYCSDMTRTVAFGYVTEEMEHVYNTVLKAQLACLEGAKLGMPGKEIDALARNIITEAGYGECFQHGLGHCIGLAVHEGPRANKIDTTPLEAGNILTIEPGIYIEGKFGVRIEDMLYFTEEGTVNLTHMPKELLIIK